MRNANQERCDKLWAEAIKERAGKKSELSQMPGPLEAHHIFKKGTLLLRYDLRNGIALTAGEHRAAHSIPAVYARIQARLSLEDLADLKSLKHRYCAQVNWTKTEESLKASIAEFKERNRRGSK